MQANLSLHACDLVPKDGEDGTFCVVTQLATSPGMQPHVLGKTEVIKNSINPRWMKVFGLVHDLGTPAKLAVSLFNESNVEHPLGCAEFDIDQVLGAPGNTIAVKLFKGAGAKIHATIRTHDPNKGGGFKIGKYEVPTSAMAAMGIGTVAVAGAGAYYAYNKYNKPSNNQAPVPPRQGGGAYNPSAAGGAYNPAVPSVGGAYNPAAHPTGGAYNPTVQPITGAYNPSATQAQPQGTYVPGGVPAGGAFVPGGSAGAGTGAYQQQNNKFLEYISGGCEINATVAIDFTGSNGDPRKPGTLHSLHELNDYQKAINAILTVLEKYDTDKQYPVFGFGAKYGGVVRHLFQCGPTAEAHGVQGVVEAYKSVFSTGLIMSGPTVFTEVIDSAANRAVQSNNNALQQGRQAYTILLIITDGAVSDVNATVAALDRASQTPLSVVIIGVGNADFSQMQFLDDYASMQPGRRDIAQFVQFNNYANNSAALTSETLHEIPQQLTEFFQTRNIQPSPPLNFRNDGQVLTVEQNQEVDLEIDLGSGGGSSDEEIVITGGGNKIQNSYMPTATQVAMAVGGAAVAGGVGYGAYQTYNKYNKNQQQQTAGANTYAGAPPQGRAPAQNQQTSSDDFVSGFGK